MRLTVLQVNDSHGYLEPHQEYYWKGGTERFGMAGGYAHIAGYFRGVREEHPDSVIALDNGDTLHGTYPAVHTEGRAMVPVLNYLGFDAMTAHWEFAYGPEGFERLARRLDYPVLAINCHRKRTGSPLFQPSTILRRKGLRIGVIGIASNIVDKTMPRSYSRGIEFTLGKEELPGHIRYLREREHVDLVIVLSHLGYPQDLKLAGEVDGIDVLLSGHTHNRLYEAVVVNGAIVIQSGCHGSFVGRLDLDVEAGRIGGYRHELVSMDEKVRPDPEAEALVEAAVAPYREMLDTPAGRTATALTRNQVLESTMDNLLLQAIGEAAGTELAFSNGWRYGAPVPPGEVKLNDLWDIIPVDPPVSTCEITGEEILELMEENLEHTFSRDPYRQMGGYVKRCLGLNVYFKVENPAGRRIQEAFTGGRPLDRKETYRAAFVTVQGIPERYGTGRQSLKTRAIDSLREYLARHDPASSGLRGTIRAI